ncbi:hypothetical protein Tsubulata_027250 [Turnera subulata]|uniref:Myb/SANT-like domain-containing protein n=1 Tax=Turnera subulata TaxID=218843 RepID=A0A9Q0F036_9ROSI|nr:hypothetical protein Tsubulata_027250 [Turnera subulata]
MEIWEDQGHKFHQAHRFHQVQKLPLLLNVQKDQGQTKGHGHQRKTASSSTLYFSCITQGDIKLKEALRLVNLLVEELLVVRLPSSGIKPKPHIESRMQTLKTHFSILCDMIASRGTSGFGWDNDRKCITAEKSIWEEYLKSHPDAEPFRYKSFPFYEELSIIFGKDRATGKGSIIWILRKLWINKQHRTMKMLLMMMPPQHYLSKLMSLKVGKRAQN